MEHTSRTCAYPDDHDHAACEDAVAEANQQNAAVHVLVESALLRQLQAEAIGVAPKKAAPYRSRALNYIRDIATRTGVTVDDLSDDFDHAAGMVDDNDMGFGTAVAWIETRIERNQNRQYRRLSRQRG